MRKKKSPTTKVTAIARGLKVKKGIASFTRATSSREPQTMEELLAQFGNSFVSLSLGDKVSGKVIKKEPGRLILDIGGKSEGLVAEKAYKEAQDFIETLKEGDEVEATVLIPETPEGYTILSLRNAQEEAIWSKILECYEKGTPIEVIGRSVSPSGLSVDVKGITGFIPTSQLGKEALQNPQALIGRSFKAVIIDAERESKKVVLSEKEVSEKEELAKVRVAIKNIKEGDIFDGKVLAIYDFGCFVGINTPLGKRKKEKVALEGLVHISELSWGKVEKPSDVVSVGQEVKVKVIGKKNDKLAFSIKQTQKDPWEDIEKRYEKDQKVKGKVVKISDYGAFVLLEPGVEGLIHITKIPPDKRLAEGEEVSVYIEEVDKEKRKISLGLVLTEKPVGYK